MLIVVVIYEENIFSTNVYKSLLKYVTNRVYIFDNSKRCLFDREIEDNWIYNFNGSNDGISKAYNIASIFARKHNFQWMIFCDQDTIFPKNFVKTIITHIDNFPDIKLFVPNIILENGKFISPLRKYFCFTKASNKLRSGILEIEKYVIINSGMVVSLESFLQCGGYNEKVWLDYSDLQFIERFGRFNKNFYAINIIAKQNFSGLETDTVKLVNRFKIFCDSVLHYKSFTLVGRIKIFILVLKRVLSLTIKTRKIQFINLYIKYYLLK